MSIRVRLVLSYLAMLVVPVILSAIAVGVLYTLDETRDNPLRQVLEREAAVYADLKLTSIREPEAFLRPAVIEDFERRLSEVHMNLIIRVDGDVRYASPELEPSDLEQLPAFGTIEDYDREYRGHRYISRHEDFLLPDKREGSLFVVSASTFFPHYVQGYFAWMILLVLGILALTNGVLTYLVSRSIIRPLKALQKATEEIKEGNLGYEVKTRSKDEIGKLSAAFEEMRKKLKQSVDVQLQYEENRKELISNISHDLKTPVTAIKGYMEGILDGVADSPDKLDRYVRTVYSKAVDMDRLIDELFLFSKLDLGKVPFHFERVDIGAYLTDCAQEATIDMEKKGIKLELGALPEQPAQVKADREKLKRVLVNILENAMKYMDKPDGRVVIRAAREDGEIVIAVSDNGPGISEEELPLVFDRFYRADPSRNTSTGGSGLGLSIARQIVEEHGGRIWAAHGEYGIGTTIYMALPEWNKPEREEERN
ncbi:sensor histidine kinase [Paenibacillaceae bacterium WGS1546]|uniref:sensor histidine kinase n=1 Tax=Cohnella sp. WGS1546 TaxID=3366810 RepID=UPI00372D176F